MSSAFAKLETFTCSYQGNVTGNKSTATHIKICLIRYNGRAESTYSRVVNAPVSATDNKVFLSVEDEASDDGIGLKNEPATTIITTIMNEA